LCIKQLNTFKPFDSSTLNTGHLLKNVISGIRDVRNKQQVKPKETIELFIQTENEAIYKSIEAILSKQLNTSSINFTNETIAGSFTTIIERDKFYIVTEKPIDSTNQKAELEKELNHLKGFLLSVEKKLSNEKFVQNAKAEVLAIEQKKKADAESKIKTINESLALLN
jgi:valyl-tRNA synthetase